MGSDLLPELFSPSDWRILAEKLGLTPRQRQIARLICRGRRTDGIARSLRIAPATVRMHKQGLFKRLGIHDRIGVPVRLVLAQRRIAKRGKN